MGVEHFITRCAVCGTQYTARSWYWLEPVSDARSNAATAVELRVCAVPGCCHTLTRASEVALALAQVGRDPANDVA